MTTPGNERTHDVYLMAGKPRFRFRNDNRGVTLTDTHIAWTADGRADGAPFRNIASVALQQTGSWQAPIGQCRITFADGYTLTLFNADAGGRRNAQQAVIYREFVRDLHQRLAAHAGNIRFTAGLPPGRYHVVLVCAVLLGLICFVGPLALLPFTRDLRTLGVMFAGGMLCWPLVSMMRNNAPRSYQPDRLPEEVLS